MSEYENPFDDVPDEETVAEKLRSRVKADIAKKKTEQNPFTEHPPVPDAAADETLVFTGRAPDLDEVRRLRMAADAKEANGHTLPKREFAKSGTATDLNTPSPNITSPAMTANQALAMERIEEIEAELTRKMGRYIPAIDDVKPGVPYKTEVDERITMLDQQTFAVPLISTLNVNSDGFTVRGGDIFDPGQDAQKAKPVVDYKTNSSANPNDPRSESFLTCNNKSCSYREMCLRYRLRNRRPQSFPFFPESCRADGIYININDSDYTGYDPFETLEYGSVVSKLPAP